MVATKRVFHCGNDGDLILDSSERMKADFLSLMANTGHVRKIGRIKFEHCCCDQRTLNFQLNIMDSCAKRNIHESKNMPYFQEIFGSKIFWFSVSLC